MKRRATGLLAALSLAAGCVTAASALASEAERPPLPKPLWSFAGILGSYDKPTLRRGFLVYMETCSGCHSLRHVAYRDLTALGVGFSPEDIKGLAAEFKIEDGPDEEGKMFRRAALPSDRIVSRFANRQAAQHANKGIYPPDLSLITKARAGGSEYLYAMLIGYEDPPAGTEVTPGMYYNRFAPGGQLAMDAPLSDDVVEYDDGTQASVDQMARDVTEFLSWAADPHREIRHSIGSRVVIFLLLLTLMLVALKREVWAHLDRPKKTHAAATAPTEPAAGGSDAKT